MKCFFCKQENKWKRFHIKSYTMWRLELHSNQCYLGRCLLALKDHKEDIFEITDTEREELYKVVPQIKKAISETFQPDMFNYTSLGNEVSHVHLHIIPRYRKGVIFNNQEFTDENWGKNPSPYNKNFKISSSTTDKVIDVLQKNL